MKEYAVPTAALDLSNWSHVSRLPRSITPTIIDVCRTLTPDAPAYVPCIPGPSCKCGHCYSNVEMTVEQRGGQAVFGWSLWDLPGIWLYAEHHCVWRMPNGELVCVTPQLGHETRILFLSDAAPEDRACHYLPYERHPLGLLAKEHQEKRMVLIEEGRFQSMARQHHDDEICRLLHHFEQLVQKRAAWAKTKEERAMKKMKRKRK